MVLENKTIGLVKDVKLINPWLTTALYQVVYSEAEADFVISGDYIFQASTNNSYEEKFIRETSESLDKKLPISYYTFSASCEASLAGKAVITKKDGTAIGTIPFGDKKSKSESKHITKPNVPSTASFVNDLKGEAIVKTVYVFSPRLEVEKFKFEDVKTKNKDLKKELKELEKQAETLVKVGDINGAGKKYLEISAKEESSDINCNIAVCYEIIGNLTKAKEYYDKSANKDGIIRINKMIAVREKFKGLGLQVVENEF
jgi:tetratricopeptide (TPR) repeat protein